VVNLIGTGEHVTSQSTINLDLVQPFLRGGGLAVTLENLTQAERNLIYQVRLFARFRKTFYVAIAGGGGGSITGGTFQPTNVIAASSFSPDGGFGRTTVVPGLVAPVTATLPIFGEQGPFVGPGAAGFISLQTALNAPVSGYLSTLLEAAQMQVDRYNIENLDGFLNLAKGLKEGGDISQLQVDQFEQQLLSGRQKLLNDQQDYLQSLDQFKLQLGIPPSILIDLDDSPFRPINAQFQRYEDLFNAFVAVSEEPRQKFGGPEMVAKVRGELRRLLTTSEVVRGTRFSTNIVPRWNVWQKRSAEELDKQLAALREERRKLLDKQTDLQTSGQPLNPADEQRLEEVDADIDLGEFEKAMRTYEAEPWKKLPAEAQRRLRQRAFSDAVDAFIIVLTQARNERMKQLHDQWPKLDRICVSNTDLMKGDLVDAETVAAQYALLHRLDLMNVRAQVVDAWRQLKVFANALLGTFNVAYHMDSTTPAAGGNPLAFSGARGHEQLSLNTQLPLVRIQERNDYRAALINYQRARRILQRAEDEVQYDVRQELILLRQQEEIYRIQTRQVELAYMVVENSLDTLRAPPAPVTAGQAPPDTATRAAALTNQLINAQTSLYNAQFGMTTIWITYLNTRLQLYRDMELMPLDYRGVWIDNIANCECPPDTKESENKSGSLETLPEPKELPAAPKPPPPPEPKKRADKSDPAEQTESATDANDDQRIDAGRGKQ
jgi:hypothetical protein